MSKKKKHTIGKIDSMSIFQAQKPRFNAFQTGTGTHGDTKFNRRKAKESTRREIQSCL